MKSKSLRSLLPMLAAALMLPASAAADCKLVMHGWIENFQGEGHRTVGFTGSFGDGQTVYGADFSQQLGEKLIGRVGLAGCRSGMTEIAFGGLVKYDAWASEDGMTTIQVGGGFNYVSFNGAGTTVLPFTGHVTYQATEEVTVYGGPSLSYYRFSGGVFSTSTTEFGLQFGAMYRAAPEWCVGAGFDWQNFGGGSTSRLNVGVYWDGLNND
ncbi:MAG: hypothetical protein AAF389_14290 [Gemmatimonadota bacterium]